MNHLAEDSCCQTAVGSARSYLQNEEEFLHISLERVQELAGCKSSHRINSFKMYSGIMALVSDQFSEISVSSHFDSMLIRQHETFKGGEGVSLKS